MERLNQIILVIGRRGEGKTWFTLNKLLPKMKLKKLVVDVFDHPDYSQFGKSISLHHFDRFNTSGKNARIYGYDINDLMPLINTKISNTVILFEDSKRYIEPNIQKDFRRLIIEHRNKNIDLVFQFHNLADVPPYLAAMYNVVVLFRTNDNFDKSMEKFSNWKTLCTAHGEVVKRSEAAKRADPSKPFYQPLIVRMQ
jgi:hypothetical protein